MTVLTGPLSTKSSKQVMSKLIVGVISTHEPPSETESFM